MVRISLSMIVKNEADLLPACLQSVRGAVDEMVLVDTGSQDGTPEWAARCGARVFHFPWCDDFSAARNAALEACTGEWVLILDADEELDPASVPLIRRLAEDPAAWAWRMTIRNYLPSGAQNTLDTVPEAAVTEHPRAARFSHQTEFQGLRLFRRAPWVRFAGRIHELVDDCFTSRGLSIASSDALIHHFGKTMDTREAEKRTYYLELARRDVAEHPESKQAHFNLLQQALTAWEWDLALQAAEAYRYLSKEGPALVLLGGAVSLQALGRHDEAIAWFASLLDAQPDHGIAWTRLGVSLASLGDSAAARRSFERAVAIAPHYVLTYLNASELEISLQCWGAAREMLERGLSLHPTEARLWERLVQVGLASGQAEHAARDAARALRYHPAGGGGMWHRLVAVSLVRLGRTKEASAILDAGLAAFPADGELAALKVRI